MSAYKVSLRELRFFLWELFEADKRFLAEHGLYGTHDRASIDAMLERARDFALDLGRSYQQADVEGCTLLDDRRCAFRRISTRCGHGFATNGRTRCSAPRTGCRRSSRR